MLSINSKKSKNYEQIPQVVCIDDPDLDSKKAEEFETLEISSGVHSNYCDLQQEEEKHSDNDNKDSDEVKDCTAVVFGQLSPSSNKSGHTRHTKTAIKLNSDKLDLEPFSLPLHCITTGNSYVDRLLYDSKSSNCFNFECLPLIRIANMISIWTFVLLFIDFILFGTIGFTIIGVFECILLAIGGLCGYVATTKFDKNASKLFYYYTVLMLAYHCIVLTLLSMDFVKCFLLYILLLLLSFLLLV